MHRQKQNTSNGFTIIELIVSIAVFAILASGILGAYSALSRSVKVAREKTILSTLSAQYLEIVRNMPYSQVGTVNGNPSGTLADSNNPILTNYESKQYKIFYEVTYLDDPADGTILLGTDVAPNDYKQVKLKIQDPAGVITSFLTNVSPQGLEGTTNAGAIQIQVINAQGQPVPGASVHIENLSANPNILLDRTSDSSGKWIEVGLPEASGAPGKLPANSYHVVVTKSGYSSDQTYPITVTNPNPVKPDATVLSGQVTSITLSIDLLSNLTIKTLNEYCQNLSGINVNVKGAKIIGTSPTVLKFDQSFTSSSGQIPLNSIEWDTYTPTLLTGQSVMVYGTSPIQQINVLPGSTQVFTMILGPVSTNSLLVIVKDSATGVALEGAVVHLQKGGSTPQDYYATTGGSVWTQIDWTGGPGQAAWTDKTRYFVDDGNIDVNSAPTGVRLNKTSGRYALSGWLESSTFDTGSSSNFTTLSWDPTSQDPAATLKFQVAANNDNATWNYTGPDGTAATYYTVPGSSLHSSLDNNRYVRYKAFLSTTNDKKTPVLTGVYINYVSGCFTPGQVIFPSLTAGNNYDLDITLAGYQTATVNNLNISGSQVLEVLMSP